MPDPLFLAGMNSTLIVKGRSLRIQDGRINRSQGVDDVSSNMSGGWYEDVALFKKYTITGIRAIYDGNDPPTFEEGEVVAATVSIPSGKGFTGNWRANNIEDSILTVTAAVRYSFDLTSQGRILPA